MPSSQPLYRTLHPINIPNVVDVVDGKRESIGIGRLQGFCYYYSGNLPSSILRDWTKTHSTPRERFCLHKKGVDIADAHGQAWLSQSFVSVVRSFILFVCSLMPSSSVILVGQTLSTVSS